MSKRSQPSLISFGFKKARVEPDTQGTENSPTCNEVNMLATLIVDHKYHAVNLQINLLNPIWPQLSQ